MNNVEICTLKAIHIDEISKINSLSFHTPWSKEAIYKELDNKFARYVVAIMDGKVIGYGGVWIIVDEGHITNIAVHPEYRGIGAGDMIVDSIIEICRLEDVEAVTLEVRESNIPARRLYEKHGFIAEAIRKGYYQDTKEDAIIMWNRHI
ncbi:ribosomal protein S18-alanine N-acetyltransferase [Clostridium omnivorum]|uniref:[Ribosomal protein bS18]-alanine N-acetyltransferase n=1 Tax=Clostridium omnivorum TaxID=1604902 RepID=A0ABQ5N2C5_9CLOT|nr:ribosomal protein S18-alanine N-acetyltransferase [Clostridium sp. E14]GLC29336.1 ribosomal-protein-alanine acetyltransferase [Clostridium sp. E14]